MSERNHTLAYALGHVNAAYIAEAEIPALTAAAACPCRDGKERNTPRFWESGWFAAAVSGIVAAGVLSAIILAGQRDPRPPIGTDDPRPPVTETETAEVETREPIPSYTRGLEYRELAPTLVEVVGIGTATDATVIHIPPKDDQGRDVLGIAEGAFAGNTRITELVFSSVSSLGVFRVGSSAFEDCTNLRRVRLCYNITSVTFNPNCFKGCSSLSEIDYRPENDGIYLDASALEGTPWLESQTDEFVIFNGILVRYQGEASDVVLPDDVWAIGRYAFDGCHTVTSVTASESSLLTSLSSHTFTGASSLKIVDLPSLEGIYGTAFEGCPALETVYVPLSVNFLCYAPAADNPTVYLYAGTEKDWERIDFWDDDSRAGWDACITFASP